MAQVLTTTWINIPPPYPPDDLLALCQRTRAGITDLVTAQPNANWPSRQSALYRLGRETAHALMTKLLFNEMRVTAAADISHLVNTLSAKLFKAVAIEILTEAHLLKGKSESQSENDVEQRLVAAFLHLTGSYCLAGMSDQLEKVLLPYFREQTKKHLPGLAEGVYSISDYKTRLQEISQGRFRSTPVYEVIHEEGPDHDKRFTVRVTVKGLGVAEGIGKSKKTAEQDAAKSLLSPLMKKEPDIARTRVSADARGSRPISRQVQEMEEKRFEKMPLRSLCDDVQLIRQALTHVSFAQNPPVQNSTGLATVGDWIVRVYVVRKATQIFWNSEILEETGHVLGHFHRRDAFAELFDKWGLHSWVLLGEGQRRQGCTSAMKENFVQALAGACYVSAADFEVVLRKLDDWLGGLINRSLTNIQDPTAAAEVGYTFADPKTLLQRVTQTLKLTPEYRLWEETGPAHNRRFRSALRVMLPTRRQATWLIGPQARSRTESEGLAATAYLKVMRYWILRGHAAALQSFETPSEAAIDLVDQVSSVVLNVNLSATSQQFRFLQQIGLSLLPPLGTEPATALKVFSGLDVLLNKAHDVPNRFISIGQYAVPRWTAGELDKCLGQLSEFLESVTPDTWNDRSAERARLLRTLIYLPSLLKWFVGDQQVIELRDYCREAIKAEQNVSLLFVLGIPKLVDWLFDEIREQVDVQSITMTLVDNNIDLRLGTAGFNVPEPNSFIDVITRCKDALLFGAGIKSLNTGDHLCLSIAPFANGPLTKEFLEEGCKQLAQLAQIAAPLHDVKNVFAAIEVLSRQSRRNQAGRYRLQAEMQDKLQKVRGLISTLRLMSGTYRQPKKVTIAVDEFVAQYRQRVILVLPPNIDFSTHGEGGGDKALVEMDVDLIFFAFDNIVKNAWEAVHESHAQISLEWVVDRKGGSVLFSISDDSPGMSDETLKGILTEGISTKKASGGTGLGLRSVRRIVEAHSGTFSIQSRVGVGTQIYIDLPLAQPDLQYPDTQIEGSLGAEEGIL